MTKYVPINDSGEEGPSFLSLTAASLWVISRNDPSAWRVEHRYPDTPAITGPLGVLKLTRDDWEALDRIETPRGPLARGIRIPMGETNHRP